MKVVLYRWLFLCSSLISVVANSQNLVQNWSFEQVTSCSPAGGLSNNIVDWYNATKGTPDFFNGCYSSVISTPKNFVGYQKAHTGVGYLGFVCKDTSAGANYREYVSSKLISPLIANRKYIVSFYVSLADSSRLAVDKIGMYLSSDSIYEKNDTNFAFKPQVGNSGTIISDTMNWTQISDTITAVGGEQFITIGNFYSDKQTQYKYLLNNKNLGTNYAYYYIDDVSVTLISGDGIQNFFNPISFSIFPNPASTTLTIQTSLSEHPVSIALFNLLGQNISETQPPVSSSYSVDVGDLPKGVYIVQVQDLRTGGVGRQEIVVE